MGYSPRGVTKSQTWLSTTAIKILLQVGASWHSWHPIQNLLILQLWTNTQTSLCLWFSSVKWIICSGVVVKWNSLLKSSVQFSSVTQSCPTLGDPMHCSMPGFPVYHQLPEFTQTHIHWASNHLILCHPLLFLPSIFPSIRVFSNKSATQ